MPLGPDFFILKTFRLLCDDENQGQTFKAVGIDLTEESFTHERLYVALSQVRLPRFSNTFSL